MEYELFAEYKKINIEILDRIKYDDINVDLLDLRDDIIKRIVSAGIEKEVAKSIYLELKLNELDMQIKKELEKKLIDTRKAIERSRKGNVAIRGYNKTNSITNFYSVKI